MWNNHEVVTDGAVAAQELHSRIRHWVVSKAKGEVIVRTNRIGFNDEVTVCVYCGND